MFFINNKYIASFIIIITTLLLSIIYLPILNSPSTPDHECNTDIRPNYSYLGPDTPEYNPIPDPDADESQIFRLADNIVSGGVPKDGIPSINIPGYICREEADQIYLDSDIIFGLDYEGYQIAYPRRVLVQHEIVNTVVNTTKMAITYCPLTGSVIGFKTNLFSHQTTFGTSGKLVNSNLVMYDRLSNSYWPQIQGQAVTGVSKGVSLEKIQLFWTTWGNWKTKFPNTLAMSDQTGFLRNYYADPYGSYQDNNSYYNDGLPLFPVYDFDLRLEDKDVVIGIEVNQKYLAVEKRLIQQEKVINTQIDNIKIVIIYDEVLDAARVFYAQQDGQDLTFKVDGGKIMDLETQNEALWNPLYI